MSDPSSSMVAEPVAETSAWRGPSLARDQYLMPIPAECARELEAVLAELRAAPVPTLLLLPEHFRLGACARFMAEARKRLDDGPGFVVLDRLALDAMSRPEAVDLYWLLGNLLEPPVAQEWKGTVIYDVRHEGTGLHRRHARRAHHGRTRDAHNHFLREAPGLLRRLYEPFYRDHQEYQAADAAVTNFRPVFAWDGRLRTRFNARHTFRGYEKTGRMLDPTGATAVRLMDQFLEDPGNRLDLWLEPGQIQILNNRVIVHGRTPYEDHEEPERRRHLVRLWLRAGDRRHFRG